MRCDQTLGLPDAAVCFLRDNEVTPPPCPHCNRPFPPVMEPTGDIFHGMFDEEYTLFRHQLKDGRYADEYLQAQPWSSGPVSFIGLRVYDRDGNLTDNFYWDEYDIDNA